MREQTGHQAPQSLHSTARSLVPILAQSLVPLLACCMFSRLLKGCLRSEQGQDWRARADAGSFQGLQAGMWQSSMASFRPQAWREGAWELVLHFNQPL